MIKWFKSKQNGVVYESSFPIEKLPSDEYALNAHVRSPNKTQDDSNESDLGILVINRREAKLISKFLRDTFPADNSFPGRMPFCNLLRAVENAHNDDFDPINRQPW